MLSLPMKWNCFASGFAHHSRHASSDPQLAHGRYLRPLNRGGEVADDCFEPHVEFFRFPTRLLHRDRDTPIEVARDRARLKSLGFDLAQRLAEDGIAHVVGAFLQELLDIGFEFGEVEIKMFGLA